MSSDTIYLKKQAEQTAEHLAEKVREFEMRVTTEVRGLLPVSQIRRHPLPAVGAAAVVGFAVSYWFPKIRSVAERLAEGLDEEIVLAKKLGASLLLERLGDRLSSSE